MTDKLLDILKSEIQVMLSPGKKIEIEGVPMEAVSKFNHYLQPNFYQFKKFSLSFHGQFTCINTKCEQVVWCSSRATMQFHYQRNYNGKYSVNIRAFRQICKKCGNKCDVELDEGEEEQVERLIRFMSCKMRFFMREDTLIEKHFIVTAEEAL